MVDGGAQVDRIYRMMPQTVDEAFAVLRNNVIQFIGEADQATGASQKLADGIVLISKNLETVAVVAGAVLGSMTVRMVGFAAATAGALGPVGLLAAAAGALASAFIVYGDDVSLADDKTVTLHDSVLAIGELAGGAAKDGIATLTKAVRDLAAANDEAKLSLKDHIKETAAGFSQLIARAILLQQKIAIGPSLLDGLFALDAALGKIQQRAAAISSERAFPDFGKLIRDAEAGKLLGPPNKKVAGDVDPNAKKTAFQREIDQIKKRTAALQAEAETIGATTLVQEKAKAAAELRYAVMATAAKEGRKVTEAELASIEKLADAYAAATAQAEFLGVLQQSRETETSLRGELELVGLFGEELYRARNEQELLNAARRAGVTLTPEQNEQLRQQAALNAMLERQRELQIEFQASAKEAMTSFIADIRQGVSATEALGNSLNKLADRLIDMAVSGLVESALGGLLGGGKGGGGGSILSALGLADGGLVRGPGTGRSDSIPARLSNGEYVVNAAATRRNLPLLEAINSKGATKFADGGLASPSVVMPNLSQPAANTPAAPAVNVSLSFNVQNGTPEAVEKLRAEMVPTIRNVVRREVGELFDRSRRFTRSGL